MDDDDIAIAMGCYCCWWLMLGGVHVVVVLIKWMMMIGADYYFEGVMVMQWTACLLQLWQTMTEMLLMWRTS